MDIEAINAQLLRAIGAGVAILDPDTLELRFANRVFGEWFDGAVAGASLAAVMPDLDHSAVENALFETGRYSAEASFRRKRRMLVIALTFTQTDAGVVLLECQNITRIRELETMIESYSAMVERNTREIQREKERVEKLLLNIMPRSVYEEYRAFGTVTPQSYAPVSILTLDFINFDTMAEQLAPAVLVSEMNDIYASFDRIGEQFGCERIKTLGDSYIAVSGLPEPAETHAESIANAALRFLRYLERRNESHPQHWRCRIGLACGQVIGSVVGIQKYVYDVFGPAVNLAGKLREAAGPMEVRANAALVEALGDGFVCSAAGVVEDVARGPVESFQVEGALGTRG
ncbi:MAG: adenylate/guanylate cyclase domain-containing protein [Pseudomonadota bacterium]